MIDSSHTDKLSNAVIEAELRLEMHKLEVQIPPLKNAIKTFDEEENRGILHKLEYIEKMEKYKRDLPALMQKLEDTWAKLKAVTPPIDWNNHTFSCGCIHENGQRVHWCGDHF